MNIHQNHIIPDYTVHKFTKFRPIPIRLCRLSKENPKLRLSYCKNRGLLYAISLIGEYKGVPSKKSPYKRGIDYLYYALNEDDSIITHVSKSEIRRLIYPCNKRKHCLKIPLNTLLIIEAIANHIDNPSDNSCRSKCKAMRQFQCKQSGITSLDCYGYLIKELKEQLFLLRDSIDEDSFLHEIVEYIFNDTQTPKCTKL